MFLYLDARRRVGHGDARQVPSVDVAQLFALGCRTWWGARVLFSDVCRSANLDHMLFHRDLLVCQNLHDNLMTNIPLSKSIWYFAWFLLLLLLLLLILLFCFFLSSASVPSSSSFLHRVWVASPRNRWVSRRRRWRSTRFTWPGKEGVTWRSVRILMFKHYEIEMRCQRGFEQKVTNSHRRMFIIQDEKIYSSRSCILFVWFALLCFAWWLV